MRHTVLMTVVLAAIVSSTAGAQQAPAPKDAIWHSARALGMLRGVQLEDSINTLEYWGIGTIWEIGPKRPWPPVVLKSYRASVAYNVHNIYGMRVRVEPASADALQREIEVVADRYVWNESRPGFYSSAAPAEALTLRLLRLWMLPHGFVKAARQGAARTRIAVDGGVTTITAPVPGLAKTTMRATLNVQHLIDRVEARFKHPLLGETTLEAVYTDYQDLGRAAGYPADVLFPARIVQRLGGDLLLDLIVEKVNAYNPYVVFPIPAQVVTGGTTAQAGRP